MQNILTALLQTIATYSLLALSSVPGLLAAARLHPQLFWLLGCHVSSLFGCCTQAQLRHPEERGVLGGIPRGRAPAGSPGQAVSVWPRVCMQSSTLSTPVS